MVRGAGPPWPELCARPEQLIHHWAAILGRLGEPLVVLPDGVAQGARALQFSRAADHIRVRCTGVAWTQRELAPFKSALNDAAVLAGAARVEAAVEF